MKNALSGHNFGSELTVTPVNYKNQKGPEFTVTSNYGEMNIPANGFAKYFNQSDRPKYLTSNELTSFSSLIPAKDTQNPENSQEITLENILQSSYIPPPKFVPNVTHTYKAKPRTKGPGIIKIETVNFPQSHFEFNPKEIYSNQPLELGEIPTTLDQLDDPGNITLDPTTDFDTLTNIVTEKLKEVSDDYFYSDYPVQPLNQPSTSYYDQAPGPSGYGKSKDQPDPSLAFRIFIKCSGS